LSPTKWNPATSQDKARLLPDNKLPVSYTKVTPLRRKCCSCTFSVSSGKM